MSKILTKHQKNLLLDDIKYSGMKPAEFEFKEAGDYITIRYIHEDYFFEFRYDSFLNEWFLELSPGNILLMEKIKFDNVHKVFNFFRDIWLVRLKEEIEEPDLWLELEQYRSSISITPPENLENELIPPEEAEQIIESIHLLSEKIEEEFDFSADQLDTINARLSSLEDAVKKFRRPDLFTFIVGTITVISFLQGLSPEVSSALLELCGTYLGHYVNLIGSHFHKYLK